MIFKKIFFLGSFQQDIEAEFCSTKCGIMSQGQFVQGQSETNPSIVQIYFGGDVGDMITN